MYCYRYKAHIKFLRFNISEDGMRIQVENPENLKAKSQSWQYCEEFEYVKKGEEWKD